MRGIRVAFTAFAVVVLAMSGLRARGDAALLMNVLSKPDARDFMSLPFQECDYTAGRGTIKGHTQRRPVTRN